MNKKLGTYKHMEEHYNDCYDRSIAVFWNEGPAELDVEFVLSRSYDQWVNTEENPEVEDWCLEEWQLHRLEESFGPIFDYMYIDEKEDLDDADD